MTDIDFLQQPEIVDFIIENERIDVSQILLNPPKQFKQHIRQLTDQILARQKAAGKLDHWRQNKRLIFPPPLSVEQASSDATAKYKRQLAQGSQLVDLTGGTGIDCLALSENFERATYVEQQSNLCTVFEHNASVLQKQVAIVNDTAERFLLGLNEHVDFIYLDPARRDTSKKKVFKLEDCSPNLVELFPTLKEKAHRVLVKLSPLLDITETLHSLTNVKEVHVVSVKNDCKELLLLIDFYYAEEAEIFSVNLGTEQPSYRFTRAEEAKSQVVYDSPARYLYEPNSSLLKAGAFKSIASKYGLRKIAKNTHLYTSDVLQEDFPGRTFEIGHFEAKKEIGRYGRKINVMTRNYPLTAQALKKKFKVVDGGEFFLIGFRDYEEKPKLVIAKRII